MNTIPFDTLKFSERLQARGFSSDQAKGLAEELAAYGAGSLVSKSDMEVALAPVRVDLGLLKSGVIKIWCRGIDRAEHRHPGQAAGRLSHFSMKTRRKLAWVSRCVSVKPNAE